MIAKKERRELHSTLKYKALALQKVCVYFLVKIYKPVWDCTVRVCRMLTRIYTKGENLTHPHLMTARFAPPPLKVHTLFAAASFALFRCLASPYTQTQIEKQMNHFSRQRRISIGTWCVACVWIYCRTPFWWRVYDVHLLSQPFWVCILLCTHTKRFVRRTNFVLMRFARKVDGSRGEGGWFFDRVDWGWCICASFRRTSTSHHTAGVLSNGRDRVCGSWRRLYIYIYSEWIGFETKKTKKKPRRCWRSSWREHDI